MELSTVHKPYFLMYLYSRNRMAKPSYNQDQLISFADSLTGEFDGNRKFKANSISRLKSVSDQYILIIF